MTALLPGAFVAVLGIMVYLAIRIVQDLRKPKRSLVTVRLMLFAALLVALGLWILGGINPLDLAGDLEGE